VLLSHITLQIDGGKINIDRGKINIDGGKINIDRGKINTMLNEPSNIRENRKQLYCTTTYVNVVCVDII